MHGRRLIIQHDGASPHHTQGNRDAFAAAGVLDGWQIRLVQQPANSPDLNILDLGFFASLQRRCEHLKMGAKTVAQLMLKVERAWHEYDWQSLDHAWKHLYDVWKCILDKDGGNQYKPPHGRRDRVPENDTSSVDLTLPLETYNRVFNALNP